jgi:hypothetical protein
LLAFFSAFVFVFSMKRSMRGFAFSSLSCCFLNFASILSSILSCMGLGYANLSTWSLRLVLRRDEPEAAVAVLQNT